jgi:hypothetical protein
MVSAGRLHSIGLASNCDRCTFSRRGKSRFIVHLHDRGDNLSVRFYIQNSISLTIAMLPRII